ncbi:hypothetical protein LRAMOSA10158 [Lichtheimia ramosa]|uniref:Uncharacterized protein n=1 Tax=Lichtheimia ramosa TaxID=688394 RepID=A0A077WPY7_9FUNG|nr:hypothetical protein LRAMOSA10158 [Lichtheimia ramosa]
MQSTAQLQQAFVSAVLDDRQLNELLKDNNYGVDKLATLLEGVEQSSNVLQQQLFQIVRDNVDPFISSYTQHDELHDRLVRLAGQYTSTVDNIVDDSIMTDALKRYQDVCQQSTTNQREIAALRTVQELVEQGDRVEEKLDQSSLVEATDSLLAFETLLNKVKETRPHDLDWSALNVFNLLQTRKDNLYKRLIDILESSLENAIQYNEAEHTMRIMQRPTVLFVCFRQLDMLPAQLAGVKRGIYKHLITPFFNQCTTSRFDIHDNELRLTTKDVPGDACGMMTQLTTLLEFLSTHLLDTDQDIRHLFGNLILPEMLKLLIEKGISTAVPSSAAELHHFDRVAEEATLFEQRCVSDYGLLTPDQQPGSLKEYVDNIDMHFATKRSEKVLLEGRKVMLRRLYDVEDIGSQGRDHFQITQTPKLLSLLLADVMTEAEQLVSSHPVSARKLQAAVSDLLDLFRAIMPCYHRNHYLSHPAAALVFRNDCFWLANELRVRFAQEKMFQDAATRLESLGKSWYEVVLAQRIQVLHAILDKTQGFAMIAENRQRQQECEEAIERAVYQVTQIAPAVRGVVDESLYMKLLSSIVDSVLSRLIGDVEHIHDIGAEDSHLIAVSFNSVLKLVDVFDGYEGQSATEPLVATLVPSWRKFWLVKDLLEMGLRDIMAKFRSGELFMFEKSELIGLICALFADTDLRSSMIREIQSAESMSSPTVQNDINNIQHKPATSTRPMTWAPEDEQDDDVDMSGWDDPDDDDAINQTTPPSHTDTHLPIHPEDDHHDMSGWDDPEEKIAATQQQQQQQQSNLTSSLSMEPEDDHVDMSGWDDPDEDVLDISSYETNTPARSTKTTTSIISPKDEEEDMSGWDDPDDKIEIPHHDPQPQSKKMSILPKDTEVEDWSGWDD